MVNKARYTSTADPQILSRFDKVVENRSKALEEFMKKKADIESTDNEELVKRREELQQKQESLREQRARLEDELDGVETELNAIRSTLEKAEEEKDVISDALPVLIDKYEELRRKTKNHQEALKRLGTTETYHMWLDKVDLDSSELKDRITEEVKS